MENRTQLAVGAVLATAGGLGIALSLILDWTSLVNARGRFLLGSASVWRQVSGQRLLLPASVCIGAKG